VIAYALAWIGALMRAARENYDVDPLVFLLIYLVSVPFFYYTLFRTIRALARRAGREAALWSSLFLCAVVAPFLYVLFFGRNLPWWVYTIIALIIGQSVFSLAMKLRAKSPPAGAGSSKNGGLQT
jgi:4-hydroxybenzoate polyprenyltransferase